MSNSRDPGRAGCTRRWKMDLRARPCWLPIGRVQGTRPIKKCSDQSQTSFVATGVLLFDGGLSCAFALATIPSTPLLGPLARLGSRIQHRRTTFIYIRPPVLVSSRLRSLASNSPDSPLRPPSPPSPVASHQLRPTAHQHGRQSSPACPPGRVQGSPRGSFEACAAIQMLVVDRTSPRHVLPTNPSPSVALSPRARYANALKPARLHGSYHMAVFIQAC